MLAPPVIRMLAARHLGSIATEPPTWSYTLLIYTRARDGQGTAQGGRAIGRRTLGIGKECKTDRNVHIYARNFNYEQRNGDDW